MPGRDGLCAPRPAGARQHHRKAPRLAGGLARARPRSARIGPARRSRGDLCCAARTRRKIRRPSGVARSTGRAVGGQNPASIGAVLRVFWSDGQRRRAPARDRRFGGLLLGSHRRNRTTAPAAGRAAPVSCADRWRAARGTRRAPARAPRGRDRIRRRRGKCRARALRPGRHAETGGRWSAPSVRSAGVRWTSAVARSCSVRGSD